MKPLFTSRKVLEIIGAMNGIKDFNIRLHGQLTIGEKELDNYVITPEALNLVNNLKAMGADIPVAKIIELRVEFPEGIVLVRLYPGDYRQIYIMPDGKFIATPTVRTKMREWAREVLRISITHRALVDIFHHLNCVCKNPAEMAMYIPAIGVVLPEAAAQKTGATVRNFPPLLEGMAPYCVEASKYLAEYVIMKDIPPAPVMDLRSYKGMYTNGCTLPSVKLPWMESSTIL